jgi:SAM-dependent methyltransferase
VRASVSEYYGATLTGTGDLKTAACCTKTPPPSRVRDLLSRVPEEISARYYGCGSPWPAGLEAVAAAEAGAGAGGGRLAAAAPPPRRVLDLGCGTGRDVYVAAALVGEGGEVVGVDMTDAQLEVGRRHREGWARELGYARSNVRFVKGRIEELPSAEAAGGGRGNAAAAAAADAAEADAAGVPPGWADVIISNCVVNLSPDKPAVLRGAFATLAPGGEMHFADVYCSRRLARAARSHPVAVGECLGGALYADDFLALCRAAGFARPRVAAAREFDVRDRELLEVLGADARFFSVTFRVFKLAPASKAAGGTWAAAARQPGGGGGGGGGGEDEDEDEEDEDTRAVSDDAARGFAVGGCQDHGQTATYRGTVADHRDAFELDLTSRFPRGQPVRVCAATAAALARTWLAPHFEVTAPGPHRGAFEGCGSAGCGGSGAASVRRLAEEEDARLGTAPPKTGCC